MFGDRSLHELLLLWLEQRLRNGMCVCPPPPPPLSPLSVMEEAYHAAPEEDHSEFVASLVNAERELFNAGLFADKEFAAWRERADVLLTQTRAAANLSKQHARQTAAAQRREKFAAERANKPKF